MRQHIPSCSVLHGEACNAGRQTCQVGGQNQTVQAGVENIKHGSGFHGLTTQSSVRVFAAREHSQNGISLSMGRKEGTPTTIATVVSATTKSH